MLQAIRTRAGGIVVKTLFALLIISFGFWGIYTRSPFFQDKSPDTVIATVGDQSIRADQLQAALQPALERMRAQLGSAIDPAQAKQLGIVDTILQQLISQSLVDQETARLRLDVSDDVLRSVIFENPTFRGPDGRFNRDLFNQVLAMNRLTEEGLIARLRRDVPRNDLLQAVTAGVKVPRPVVDALYRYRNEKRVAEIVTLPVASMTDVGEPSETDLSGFYKAHPDMFRAPEYRGFTMASLTVTDMQAGIQIPEDKLKAAYEERKDDFALPEQRQLQQILVSSEDKAKEVEAALAAGKDWKEVATTIAGQSADTIDLGLMKQSEMPPKLGEVAFNLPLDRPSDPIKSPFGWHVLRVVKIVPPSTQSFDQAKAKLTADMVQETAADRLDEVSNKVNDALAGGGALTDIAARFNLKLTTVAASDIGGRDPQGKPVTLPVPAPEALKLVFDTAENETSRVAQIEGKAIYVVHTDKVVPPQLKPLADVKTQATAAWQAEQKQDSAKRAADALASAAKSDGLAKASADKNLTVTTTQPLSRRPDPAAKVPPALVAKLFGAKPGEIVTSTDATGAYVAQVKDVERPSETPAADAAKLEIELGNAERFDIVYALTEALKQRFPVDIKRAALDHMF